MERNRYLLFAGALIGIVLVVFLIFPEDIDGIFENRAPVPETGPMPYEDVAFT